VPEMRTCLHCGGAYQAEGRWSKQKYCSISCGISATRKGVAKPHKRKLSPIPCARCGMTFRPLNSRMRFCGKKCATKTTAENRTTTKGWTRSSRGYILAYRPEHPRAGTTGYIMQHRLVMEEILGRPLRRAEVVHHRNGIRDDNRPENLELLTKKAHDKLPKSRRNRIVKCPCCGSRLRLSNAARVAAVVSE
jgi:hypothetical protein